MARDLTERLEELAHALLGPLVLGGTMRLVSPIGPQLASVIGVGRRIVDDNLRTSIEIARIRRGRLIMPIDFLPDISPPEWALVAALNDLLQATNHELSGAFTRGRHAALLEATHRLIEAVPAPRTTLEVMVRHATFARLLEVTRTDITVTVWAGSATYRGQSPSKSMMLWPGLRRVNASPRAVPLHAMPEGLELLHEASYQVVLAALLSRSPLTDIATMTRDAPAFAWSRPTLELVAYPLGRSLALRALARAAPQAVVAALKIASDAQPQGSRARVIADSFAADLLARATGLGHAAG